MELSKDSPITIWLPSQRRDSLAKLKSYLKAEHNAFEDPEESADLHENFPYLTKLMAEMRHEHKSSHFSSRNARHFSSRRDLSCLATRIEEILGGFIATSRDQN